MNTIYCHKESTNIHGVAMKIYNCGILITGQSGIGKSDLALNLIDKGHQLIADDLVLITQHNNKLQLSVPDESSGFMHVRGIGFINIANLYSNNLIANNIALNLIIELIENKKPEIHTSLSQQDIYHECILGISVNKFILPINNNRPLVLLVETLVKYWLQLKSGYDSNKIFNLKFEGGNLV